MIKLGRIIGERIILREYRKEDLSCIRNWVNDPWNFKKGMEGIGIEKRWQGKFPRPPFLLYIFIA